MNQSKDPTDPYLTGSHEEFWVFSQVSQWGSNWVYSKPDYYEKVHKLVVSARQLGLANQYKPRTVHYAQILLWRYFFKEPTKDFSPQTTNQILDAAFESAARLLETQVKPHNAQNTDDHSAFKQQFELVKSLNFHIRIKHPSEYLHLFLTDKYSPKQAQLAECIISDSFLCPCCLLYKPIVIAEGAAVMAAGMTKALDSVAPQTTKSISFIQDMKFYYQHSKNEYHQS